MLKILESPERVVIVCFNTRDGAQHAGEKAA